MMATLVFNELIIAISMVVSNRTFYKSNSVFLQTEERNMYWVKLFRNSSLFFSVFAWFECYMHIFELLFHFGLRARKSLQYTSDSLKCSE